MLLKPWYDVLNMRKELCEGVSQDWLEFTVNIEKIRHGQALDEYRDPAQFFRATYLSHSLTRLTGNVMRRLLGDREHSAIFSISAPNGGGKSHALLLLHHLVKFGSEAVKWAGVPGLFAQAGVATLPAARLAAFVGTTFDSSKRRGGKRGEPVRKTPWGELAFQLGGNDAFALVADDGTATLFTHPAKITPEVAAHLGPEVQVRPYEAFGPALQALTGTVMLDPGARRELWQHAGGEAHCAVEVDVHHALGGGALGALHRSHGSAFLGWFAEGVGGDRNDLPRPGGVGAEEGQG